MAHALVSQSAEEAVLKTVQCGFESHLRHMYNINDPLDRNNPIDSNDEVEFIFIDTVLVTGIYPKDADHDYFS